MVYDQSPKLEGKGLDTKHVQAANFRERNVRINTAASDLLLQDSIDGGGSDSARLPGYKIPKLPEQDLRKNINILNWKIYRLPARGKQTYLDDVIRHERKKGSPECKLELPDWSKERNSKALHGIDTKDCFHNKGPRVMIA